jgi:alginate O-acetyltransferase complex protein AlgI
MRITATLAKVALTYFAVVVAQVFFRAATVHDALRILGGMAGLHGLIDPTDPRFIGVGPMQGWIAVIKHEANLAVLFLIVWTMPNSLQILNKFEPVLSNIRLDSLIRFEWRPNLAYSLIVGVVAAVALLSATGMTEFLYFRF